MIHRALLGSLERFFGILIEHYAGKFPTWFAPINAMLIPVADRHIEYANEVGKRLKVKGFFIKIDTQNDTVGKKIFRAHAEKIPYAVVVGDKEMQSNTVTVKNRDTQKQVTYTVDEFIEKLCIERDSNINTLTL